MKTNAVVLALLWLMVTAPIASADMGSPLPQRNAYPRIRFDNLDDYPDWAFYLEYPLRAGKANRVISGQVVVFSKNTSRHWAELIAVPQAVAGGREQITTPSEYAPEVLRGHISRVDGTVFILNLDRAYLYPCRVSIENGKLRVELSRGEPIRAEINLGFVRIPIPHVALLLSLATTVGGLYFARRRSAQITPSDGSTNTTPTPSKAARIALYLLLGFLVIIAIANFAF